MHKGVNFSLYLGTIMTISDIDLAISNFYHQGSPIEFETQNLVLRSVQQTDKIFFENWYLDYETMRLFNTNEQDYKKLGPDQWKKEQLEEAAERVDTFVKRWSEKNPFSGLVICQKTDRLPIGYIVAGLGEKGQSSLAFVITKKQQRKGFGTEAVHAMVQRYLPALIANHYKIYGSPLLVSGAPFTEVQATSRLDNEGSQKVMTRAGMIKQGTLSQDGMERCLYSYPYENPPKIRRIDDERSSGQ
jgi:RimJ/RimL family protein N-acetyltransferase